MGVDMNKGIAIGILGSYFLIGPVLNALKIGGAEIYITIGLAIYLFFIKK